jgi:hypothetical protein
VKFYLPVLSAVEQAAQEALKEVAEETLERSNELSPTLTGETDESGFVKVDDLTAQIGYRSFVARLQHEDLDYQHPRGGQAKFLETAADEMRSQIGPRMAAKIRGVLGG